MAGSERRVPLHAKFATLIGQERPIDLLRAKLDIVARHSAFPEVLLPAIDAARDGAHLFERLVAGEPEHLRHGQRIGERGIRLLFADAHLLEAQRLA